MNNVSAIKLKLHQVLYKMYFFLCCNRLRARKIEFYRVFYQLKSTSFRNFEIFVYPSKVIYLNIKTIPSVVSKIFFVIK